MWVASRSGNAVKAGTQPKKPPGAVLLAHVLLCGYLYFAT